MTRLLYGGTGGEAITQPSGDDNDLEPSTAVFDISTEIDGTPLITDLRSYPGNSVITKVTADEFGRLIFYGVDGYDGDYYAHNTADTGGDEPWWLIRPLAITDRVKAVEAALAGQSFYILPGGGIPQADLDAATETKIDNAIPVTLINAAGDLLVGTANDTIARLGKGTALQYLRVNSGATALEWATFATSDFATKTATGGGLNGSIRQFIDVGDGNITDGYGLVADSGVFEIVDLNAKFAPIDPTTERLPYDNAAKYTLFGAFIDEGDIPPLDVPIPSIIIVEPASASLIPTIQGFATPAHPGTTMVCQNAEDYDIGDDLIVFVGGSAEASTPATHNLTIESPGVAPVTMRVESILTTGAQVNLYQGKVTTAIPAGSDFTLVARNPANSANQSRAHLHFGIIKGINLASSPFDRTGTASGNNTGQTLSVATSSPTTVADELAIGIWMFNSAQSPTVRTIAAAPGWTELYNQESVAAASDRTVLVAYKVLDTIQTPNAQAIVTASDSATGQWAAAILTLKGA